jgi:hypothetical protein
MFMRGIYLFLRVRNELYLIYRGKYDGVKYIHRNCSFNLAPCMCLVLALLASH